MASVRSDHWRYFNSKPRKKNITLIIPICFPASKVAETGPQLYQVARQLSKITSSKLRVKVATGGDPSFPLRVNLRGEQVLGLGMC